MRRMMLSLMLLSGGAASSAAAELTVKPVAVTEMKAIYGQVQARTSVPARARIGGTLVSLNVTEGDIVKAGQVVARIADEKIDYQIKAVDAQLLGLKATLDNAISELSRAETLVKSGATTTQRLDQLRTQVDVTQNQIRATEAQRAGLVEQANEGAVIAPSAGRVVSAPLTRNAVVMPGETVATIAGGGFFLRLAIPERHAQQLKQGAAIRIEAGGKALTGVLAKIYLEIDAGRVTADVEVPGLATQFVGARVLVELPVGERQALLAPAQALITRSGLDFIRVREGGGVVERAVVPGEILERDGVRQVEILTGLTAGDVVVTP